MTGEPIGRAELLAILSDDYDGMYRNATQFSRESDVWNCQTFADRLDRLGLDVVRRVPAEPETMVECAWCGHRFDYDATGGQCDECDGETCVDCRAKLVTSADNTLVVHLGPVCFLTKNNGWIAVDAEHAYLPGVDNVGARVPERECPSASLYGRVGCGLFSVPPRCTTISCSMLR